MYVALFAKRAAFSRMSVLVMLWSHARLRSVCDRLHLLFVPFFPGPLFAACLLSCVFVFVFLSRFLFFLSLALSLSLSHASSACIQPQRRANSISGRNAQSVFESSR